MRSLLLALPLLAIAPRPADACSPPPCWSGSFVPQDGATVPANAPGFYFRPARPSSGSAGDASLVRLIAASDPTTQLAFTAVAQANGDYVIVPDAPLVPGETYSLEDGTVCGAGTLRSTFEAGPIAPLPTSLGALQLIGHGNVAKLGVATSSGSCTTEVDAIVAQVVLAESASAAPWKDLFLYETLVDNTPWVGHAAINVANDPGESWVGRGKDMLYRVCAPNPDAEFQGLEVGGHEVRFRASLPGAGATASLATPAEAIELMCTTAPSDDDPDTETVGDGSCSTGRPATFGFALLALGLLAARRRAR